MNRRIHCLVCVLGLLAASTGAEAQPSEADIATARKLAQDGFVALDAARYSEAVDLFSRAEQLYHAPTILVGLARAYAALGKFVEAQENYKRVVREKLDDDASDAFRRAVSDAASELADVEKKIAWVTIRIAGAAEASVTIDGVAIPSASIGVSRAINPGEHEVVAQAEGAPAQRKRFTIAPAGQLEVELSFAAGAPTDATGGQGAGGQPNDDARGPGDADAAAGESAGMGGVETAGFVSLALGGAGLVLGAIAGIMAMDAHGELVDQCPNEQCPEAAQDTLDRYQLVHPLSTVGFIAGGVLATAGIVMVLAGASGSEENAGGQAASAAGLVLRLAPTTATLGGSFH